MADVIAAPPRPAERDRQHAAYLRVLPKLQGMQNPTLLPINVDLGYVISTALSTASRIRHLRELIETLRPHLDPSEIDNLEDYALAFSYAQGEYTFATTSPEALPALREEGARTRERLLNNAISLSQFGLLPNEQITNLKGPVAYHGLAQDLTALSRLYKDHWNTISGKTPVTLEEVERASEIALQLFHDTGMREGAQVADSEAAMLRQRAFTLLVRCYDVVRRVIVFLRWDDGDADILAPSLYANRARRGKGDEAPSDPPSPPQSDITVPVANDEGAQPVAPPVGGVPAGHRGNLPFGEG